MSNSETKDRISLNGDWILKLDENNLGTAEEWYRQPITSGLKLQIPGCVQSLDELAGSYPSSMTGHNSYLGNYWLEKSFFLPLQDGCKKFFLTVGGAAPTAHIWVGGKHVYFHDEPQIELKLDITDYLTVNAENRITVLISEQNVGHLGGLRGGGFEWSGLYRDVTIDITEPVYIKAVSIENAASGTATIAGIIANGNKSDENAVVSVKILDGQTVITEKEVGRLVLKHQSETFTIDFDITKLEKWSTDCPKLYDILVCVIVNEQVVHSVLKRTGFRTFTANKTNLLLNGKPFMIRGVGHEYFSVSISPIIDKTLIRQRFLSMKAHGFNFCRYHTYPPTEEEFQVADEVGVILSSEIALISNFHKTLPPEKCLTLIEKHILLTKHHPSIGIYCLGNEGSQLMVNSYIEREKAVTGYGLIKKNAPNHLAMISFGLQGEVPELPNDIESPHLWSHDFLWGYDGLSDIPWDAMTAIMQSKPWIIHEFGKFGVWPDPKEAAIYPRNGYKANFDWQGKEALREIGLEEYENAIIKNSRRLASICNRLIIEGARRQMTCSGYVIWTYFRKGICNAGFIDDMGLMPDKNPDYYKHGCNAPVALLIDRDFIGRTLKSREDVTIGIFASNFGDSDISDANVKWSLKCGGKNIWEGNLPKASAPVGLCTKISDLKFSIPTFDFACALTLSITLSQDSSILASNSWDFWVFPSSDKALSSKIAYDFANIDYKFTFRNKFFGAVNLRELDSVIRGCRSWTGMNLEKTFEAFKPNILVTDHYGETAKKCLEHGITVFLLDNAAFPEDWYTKSSVPHLKDEDTARFFTGFRSGWDQGNLGTIIEKNNLIEDFPCEDFCDLQFYKMINGARTVDIGKVMEDVEATEKKVLIRSIAKTRPPVEANAVVQDPNAVKALELKQSRNIYAMERVFLAELKAGNGSLIINTLRILDDPAGEHLMRTILKHFE